MTSNFILSQGEEFVQCPYNLSHRITNAKILFHLEKCRKQYLKEMLQNGGKHTMLVCRFNSSHHVPSREIQIHEERCQDNLGVVKHLAYHNSEEGDKYYEARRRQDAINAVSKTWDLEEEDWETEACTRNPGYDPREKLKRQAVLYNPTGLTKSERRKFREEVRQKAASDGGQSVEFPVATIFNSDLSPLRHQEDLEDGELGSELETEDVPQHSEKRGSDESAGRKDRTDGHQAKRLCTNDPVRNLHVSGHPSNGKGSAEAAGNSSKAAAFLQSLNSATFTETRHGESGSSWIRKAWGNYYDDDFAGYDPYKPARDRHHNTG